MSETIYVIDDDDDLRESITEILEGNGFKVSSFENAEAALQGVTSQTISLAIVDNMMPGMGGMAFIPVLKKEHPHVKIIMITAFSTVDNAVTAMRSGADDYLAKPFKRDDLLVTVRRNLEELKFEQQIAGPGMDDALACLSNQIRRQILALLASNGRMRFMDITRHLKISDHTKVNFHLKNLKTNGLVSQDRVKIYSLTPQGDKMVDCLSLLSRKIPH
ncbi:response regulator [Desulfopila sp. IMCC35008]|uniref:response regulator n=1 Tax=Desulfopila sp. IMCC35008 TaxID=2653858 RepID=UPI0013D2DC17|nr:response regulator [Desulfopila sp. IMCC35008]